MPDDDALMSLLGQVAERLDPAPAQVRQAGIAAYEFRDPDAALARLIEQESLELVRDSGSSPCMFQTDDGTEVTLELSAERALGQVAPAVAGTGRVETPDGEVSEFTIEPTGEFSVPRPEGLFRLRLDLSGSRILTAWLNP